MRPSAKTKLARKLRRDLTKPEVELWVRLRKSENGLHFRRQHPIGPYVADFYCAKARLIIEVDGYGHNLGDRKIRDDARDAYLSEKGFTVYRLNASDVLTDPDEAALGVINFAQSLIRA